MANPTSFDDLVEAVIRLVKTGANYRLKNTDGLSDGKVIDPAEISGFAGTTPADLSLTAAAVGTAQTVSPGDHQHAFPNIAANTALVNATASSAKPTALAFAASRLLGRGASGNLQAMQAELGMIVAQAANTILANITAGSASPTAVAMAVQTVLARASGNISALAMTADSVLGRQGSGDLGPVKVTPNMMAPIGRQITLSGTSVAANTNLTATAGETIGTWAAISGNSQVVPEAGLYRVSGHMDASCGNAASGVAPSLNLLVNGVITIRLGRGIRFSTGTGDIFPHPGAPSYLRITTPASQALTFQVDNGPTTINVGYALIEKVGP